MAVTEVTCGLPKTKKKVFVDRKKPIVVSFPKSGRTWLRKMLYDLHLPLSFTHAGSNHYERGSIPEISDWEFLSKNSVVLLVRDPRDVLVSYYNDLVHRHQVFDGSLMDMAQLRGVGIDGICEFNQTLIRSSSRMRAFHLMRYEDLLRDTESEMSRLLGFLGASWISRPFLRQVIEDSTFDRMKLAEQSGEYLNKYPRLWFEGAHNQGAQKVRHGKAGGFLEEMPERVRTYCSQRIRESNYPKDLLAHPLSS